MDNKEKETVVIPGTEDKDVKVISFDEPKWKNGSYVEFNGNPMNGLCEKVCKKAKKVLDIL